MRQGALVKITNEERFVIYLVIILKLLVFLCRDEILAGLKKNWEQLHHQYQGLSVVTDTVPKKAR